MHDNVPHPLQATKAVLYTSRSKRDEILREMIQHENQLVSDRLGAFATLQGLLLATLGFSSRMDPPINTELVYTLCGFGILTSTIALLSLRAADKAIVGFIGLRNNKKSIPLSGRPEAPSENPIRKGWKHPREIFSNTLSGLKCWHPSGHNACWNGLPFITIVLWLIIGAFFYLNPPKRHLDTPWQFIVHEDFKKLLSGTLISTEERQKAIHRLATIPGDAERGKKVYDGTCADCHRHGGPAIDTLAAKKRDELAESILFPKQNGAKHRCMPEGIISRISPEEFSDIIEYLKSSRPLSRRSESAEDMSIIQLTCSARNHFWNNRVFHTSYIPTFAGRNSF